MVSSEGHEVQRVHISPGLNGRLLHFLVLASVPVASQVACWCYIPQLVIFCPADVNTVFLNLSHFSVSSFIWEQKLCKSACVTTKCHLSSQDSGAAES